MFRMNGYVQDERYTAGAGRAGAVPFSFARCLAQRCAARLCQVCTAFPNQYGRRGRAVPFSRTRSSTSLYRSVATSMSLTVLK